MELKKVIEGRVKGINEDLKALRNNLKESEKEGQDLQVKLAMKKKSIGEDGDMLEAKQEFLDLQKLVYTTQLVDMNIRHLLSSLTELSVVSGLAGIKIDELDIEDNDIKEEMKSVASGGNTLFRSEGGKVVVADQETYDMIMKGFEKRSNNDEAIREAISNMQVK